MYQGKIIRLLSHSVVPFISDGRGTWTCVVVESRNKNYPIGSFVTVHSHELEAGKTMTIVAAEKKQ